MPMPDVSCQRKLASRIHHDPHWMPASAGMTVSHDNIDQRPDKSEYFQKLNSKAILTSEEKIELEKILSDPDFIQKNRLILANTGNSDDTRFMALDYFEKAIAWERNPSRWQIIKSLKEIMLLDNFSDIEDLESRKSYAGDKMEIYAILKQYAPDELEIIKILPEDNRIRKVLAYAHNLNL